MHGREGHSGENSKVKDIHDLVNDILDLLIKASMSEGGGERGGTGHQDMEWRREQSLSRQASPKHRFSLSNLPVAKKQEYD